MQAMKTMVSIKNSFRRVVHGALMRAIRTGYSVASSSRDRDSLGLLEASESDRQLAPSAQGPTPAIRSIEYRTIYPV